MSRDALPGVACVAGAIALAACIHIGPAPSDAGGCDPALEGAVMATARNAVADRASANRLRLPWTDTLPPVVVRNDVLCRAAASGYAEGRLPPTTPRRAAVVRAGGLYFVLGRAPVKVGELTLIGVLNTAFRWIVGLTE